MDFGNYTSYESIVKPNCLSSEVLRSEDQIPPQALPGKEYAAASGVLVRRL